MDLLFFYEQAVTVPQCRATQKSRSILAEDQLFQLDSVCPFRGGPRSWLKTPLPTHRPSLLFSSDVSVLYQLGFPYTCFCAAVLPSVEPGTLWALC